MHLREEGRQRIFASDLVPGGGYEVEPLPVVDLAAGFQVRTQDLDGNPLKFQDTMSASTALREPSTVPSEIAACARTRN